VMGESGREGGSATRVRTRLGPMYLHRRGCSILIPMGKGCPTLLRVLCEEGGGGCGPACLEISTAFAKDTKCWAAWHLTGLLPISK